MELKEYIIIITASFLAVFLLLSILEYFLVKFTREFNKYKRKKQYYQNLEITHYNNSGDYLNQLKPMKKEKNYE